MYTAMDSILSAHQWGGCMHKCSHTRDASMFTSAMSFTRTAHFSPSLFSRMCFRSVVLPLPRNPESNVTGNRLVSDMLTGGCAGVYCESVRVDERCVWPCVVPCACILCAKCTTTHVRKSDTTHKNVSKRV